MIWLATAAFAAEDWCRPETVESEIRRWGTAQYTKKKELGPTTDALRERLARELLGGLAAKLDARYEAEILGLTSRVQTLSATPRKSGSTREVCVVVQMPKGGIVGELPSDVGKQLLASWHDPVAKFAAGRPVWVQQVALRDRAAPEVDDVVVPRIEDLVRRNLTDVARWEPTTGGKPPADVVTFDVRVTPFPGHYAVEGVLRDAAGISTSVGAELGRGWIGEIGARAPLSSRDVRIDRFDGPTSVTIGKKAKLAWSAPNARSCTITGMGDVPPSGEREVLVDKDTTWTLSCTDGLKTVTQERAIAAKIPPPLVSMWAEPATIPPGGTTNVSWRASGVASCEIDHGVGTVGLYGDIDVQPAQTTSWKVTCRAEDGRVAVSSATVTIGAPVAEAPPPTPKAKLVVRSLDQEWVEVRVDGGVVGRLFAVPEVTAEVDEGSHVVEVVPFMQEKAVASVRVQAKGVVTLGVEVDAPIVCYDPQACSPP